jgi:hypothetical protein
MRHAGRRCSLNLDDLSWRALEAVARHNSGVRADYRRSVDAKSEAFKVAEFTN